MGALLAMSETTYPLIDFGFQLGTGIARSLRLEGRVAYARAGSPSFQLGGTDLTAPTLAGDTYSAATKLAVGSYTSPGTNALSVTGNVSMPGYMFCAGTISATGSKLTSTGHVSYTVARLSGYAAGAWTITFASAHPLGTAYIINVTARGLVNIFVSSNVAPTSTTFVVVMLAQGTTSPNVDCLFNFMVLAS